MAPQESDVYALVLGKTIALLREKRGFTQGELAQHLEVAQSSMSRFEQGQVQPEPYLLKKVAEVFGLDESSLGRYVSAAFRRTEAAARHAAPTSKEAWWLDALRVGGLSGVQGLATFCVSATLVDMETSERRAEKKTKKKRPR